MPTIYVNGLMTHYTLHGPDGAPVLTFVHGQSFTLETWAGQVPAFSDRFRVLRIDLRGHGSTALGDLGDNLRMSDLAADIVGVWDLLGIEKSHYVGKSLGGMMGFEMALEYAHRLLSVTFVATQGLMPEGSLERMRGYAAEFRASERKMGLAAERLLARYLPKDFRASDPGGFAELERAITALSVDSYAFTTEAINAMRYDARLSEIKTPTMVIAGEIDAATPPARMKRYRNKIRGAGWAVIDGAAHLPNLEKPNAFNRALSHFLDAL
jgi:3-oxoadipate enol-lactonase